MVQDSVTDRSPVATTYAGFGKRISGGKERGRKSQGAGWDSWGLQLGDLGGAVRSYPSVPAAKWFSRILNTQDDLSGQEDYGQLAKHNKD